MIVSDSSFWIALYNSNDVHHAAAKTLLQQVIEGSQGPFILSDYVFQETVNVVLRKGGLSDAIEVGEFLLEAKLVELVFSSDNFFEHWRYFRSQDANSSRALSVVDASLVNLCERFDLAPIATFDKGFQGIEHVRVLPKPKSL